MSTRTAEANSLRDTVARHRSEVLSVLARYGASNPRLFGSVARGDATAASDVDLMVELGAGGGNPLMRVAGIGEELSEILGIRVDVVTDALLREPVSATARADAVPL
jgi:predicted nucleotidyltransferase